MTNRLQSFLQSFLSIIPFNHFNVLCAPTTWTAERAQLLATSSGNLSAAREAAAQELAAAVDEWSDLRDGLVQEYEGAAAAAAHDAALQREAWGRERAAAQDAGAAREMAVAEQLRAVEAGP